MGLGQIAGRSKTVPGGGKGTRQVRFASPTPTRSDRSNLRPTPLGENCMLTARRVCVTGSLVVLCIASCDNPEIVGPRPYGHRLQIAPTITASSDAGGGPKVNPPSNTNAVTVSERRIDVSWQDNSSNETGFEVGRAQGGPSGPFTQLVAAGADTAAHHDAGLDASTQYCYQVRTFRAYDGKTSYSAFSATACATTPAAPPPPPAPPVSLSAGNLIQYGLSNILLEWRAGAGNHDGFKGERCGGGLFGDADLTRVATPRANPRFFVGTQGEPGYTHTH